MGWVVGFEPTYTGATTLGLNRLTIPTILDLFACCFVAAHSIVSHDLKIAPSSLIRASRSKRKSLRILIFPPAALSQQTQDPEFPEGIGDRERARTVDLQRDRLAF